MYFRWYQFLSIWSQNQLSSPLYLNIEFVYFIAAIIENNCRQWPSNNTLGVPLSGLTIFNFIFFSGTLTAGFSGSAFFSSGSLTGSDSLTSGVSSVGIGSSGFGLGSSFFSVSAFSGNIVDSHMKFNPTFIIANTPGGIKSIEKPSNTSI